MDISEFARVLRCFSDDPGDIDIRLGKLVAQIRDELLDVTLAYSGGEERSLVVTENGVTHGARTWLLTRIAKVGQLADRIVATTSVPAEVASRAPFIEPSGRFVPDLSQAQESNSDAFVANAVEALINKATNQLPGATSVLYLTSDAGEGKTTAINRAANLQAQRYKARQTASLIVPIPLSGRTFLTFDDAVIAALVNKLRFSYFYFDGFIQLVRMGVLIPAFDGYEEMLVEGSKGEAVSALGNLVQNLESSGTVIVAARKAFFEYLSFKTQAKLLDAIGDRSASFSRLALMRWTAEQFCEYGRLRGVHEPKEIHSVVAARLGADHPILTRAVLVRRLYDVISGGVDRQELAKLLGANPHDYFFTFVDAIVRREASEKWIARVTGDISEPLLQPGEHHVLLAQIAQEMWMSSTTSLRHDVLDVIVDLFAENARKPAVAIRQIKERLKQHSLLAVDASRGQALAFDHEDFQRFYLGESLGMLLAKLTAGEIQSFLSVNVVPNATAEQAVQYLIRSKSDLNGALALLQSINEGEAAFSFCKENCAALTVRLVEYLGVPKERLRFRKMYFSAGALSGRTLRNLCFENCQFQPTSIEKSSLRDVEFRNCEFERLEIDRDNTLSQCVLVDCAVQSLIVHPDEEHYFDPAVIVRELRRSGATVSDASVAPDTGIRESDDRVRMTERFLRSFLRSTHIDEDMIRLRVGKAFAPRFMADVLPALLEQGVLEEVPWRGRGVQRRFKLGVAMSAVNTALERCNGDFDLLVRELSAVSGP